MHALFVVSISNLQCVSHYKFDTCFDDKHIRIYISAYHKNLDLLLETSHN